MGCESWHFFVPYQQDIAAAFGSLARQKRQELLAWIRAVEPEHAQRIREADERGEFPASVMQMMFVAPERGGGAVGPPSHEELVSLFGTDKPSHAAVERCEELRDMCSRGEGLYVVVYENSVPTEIFFTGCTID